MRLETDATLSLAAGKNSPRPLRQRGLSRPVGRKKGAPPDRSLDFRKNRWLRGSATSFTCYSVRPPRCTNDDQTDRAAGPFVRCCRPFAAVIARVVRNEHQHRHPRSFIRCSNLCGAKRLGLMLLANLPTIISYQSCHRGSIAGSIADAHSCASARVLTTGPFDPLK